MNFNLVQIFSAFMVLFAVIDITGSIPIIIGIKEKVTSPPKSFDEVIEERCLRKLFKDPMSEQGEWNVILPSLGVARAKKGSPQKVLVVPYGVFPSIANPQIIGVVSSSTKKSLRR